MRAACDQSVPSWPASRRRSRQARLGFDSGGADGEFGLNPGPTSKRRKRMVDPEEWRRQAAASGAKPLLRPAGTMSLSPTK